MTNTNFETVDAVARGVSRREGEKLYRRYRILIIEFTFEATDTTTMVSGWVEVWRVCGPQK